MIAAILSGIAGLLLGAVLGFCVGSVAGSAAAKSVEEDEVKEARRILARRRALQKYRRDADQVLSDLVSKGLRN